MKQAMLVGNPNCGKTTLFNALTGENQRVGNWPGVTVEKRTGSFELKNEAVQLTDLPGVYSLVTASTGSSQDEKITARAIIQDNADVIINVIDACHLERHLYLTSQLLELGKPLIVVLNMSDIAQQRGIVVNAHRLSNQLCCPVVTMQAHRQIGIDELKQCLQSAPPKPHALELSLSREMLESIQAVEELLLPDYDNPALASYIARRVLEGDTLLLAQEDECIDVLKDADIVMADARYEAVHQLIGSIQHKQSDAREHLTAKIDRIVLHRFWAFPIFLAVMYAMFLFAINIGGAFQPLIDISTDAVFVQGAAQVLNQMHLPSWVTALLAHGVGKGINTTLTFIPVIAGMFFFLSFLELSGYMARAAFVVDRLMRFLGLPGKSFVPMIIGFGCNVPAIMAARTLDTERDRLLTILMSPFMSCSARLAIYAVFVAAFFPTGGQNVVFALYLIGILMAVLTGLMLRKTMLPGKASSLVIELPAYHWPSFRRLFKETGRRLRHFLIRAGKLIIPVCVILGGLNALSFQHGFELSRAGDPSVLSVLGQWLTPLFYPMGISQENWPATVGIFTGMLAKEVVVGSLNALYSQSSDLMQQGSLVGFHFWEAIRAALWSVPENFANLGKALLNPILASAPDGSMSETAYGVMYQRFNGQIGAFAYLLFILLYVPCVSTMAAIRQEANRRLMWFSIAWSTLVAYTVAVLFYQGMTFLMHPGQALCWMMGLPALLGGFVLILFYWVHHKGGGTHVVANS